MDSCGGPSQWLCSRVTGQVPDRLRLREDLTRWICWSRLTYSIEQEATLTSQKQYLLADENPPQSTADSKTVARELSATVLADAWAAR